MQYLQRETTLELFAYIEEIWHDKLLTPKERLPKLRYVLEEAFRELTSDEFRLPAQNLFGRMVFVFTEQNCPENLKDEWHGFRQFLNKIVHERKCIPTDADDRAGISVACEILHHFSRLDIPVSLQGIRTGNGQQHFARQFKRISPDELHEFRMLVLGIHPAADDQAGKFCTIVGETEDYGLVRVIAQNDRLKQNDAPDWTEFADITPRYSTLFWEGLQKDKNQDTNFLTTQWTLAVVEPDYLVEAKKLANCCQNNFDNENIYFLRRFESSSPTEHMLSAIAVGQIFNDLLTRREIGELGELSFQRFAAANTFYLLRFGHNPKDRTFNKSEVGGKIVDPARRQIANLLHITRYFKDWKVSVEPTFHSARYGLTGRLDALFSLPNEGDRMDIVEMKSGQPPFPGEIKPEHAAQGFLYTLLLQEVFPERRGATSIFYSADAKSGKPLRDINEAQLHKKQALLMLRNRVVAIELCLANGDIAPLSRLFVEKSGRLGFSENTRTPLSSFFMSATSLEKDYFCEYCCFIFRELQFVKIGMNHGEEEKMLGFSALWQRSLEEKQERLEVLAGLEILNVLCSERNFQVQLSILPENGGVNLREGDLAVLYPTPNPEQLYPLRYQILKCNIESLAPNSITVSLNNLELDPDFLNQSRFWAIERDIQESSYDKMLRSLDLFATALQPKRDLLLGLKRPAFGDILMLEHPEIFSGNQSEIVSRALSARDYFLIQGPPGTGKTSRILTEIAASLINKGENILVIAFTNRAIGEICEALSKKGIKYLRLGRGSYDENSFERLKNEIEKIEALHAAILRPQVYVSTQSSMLNHMDLFDVKAFQTVIVDEASQLLEPQLIGILTRCERFILIGDEKQLPAVVQQPETASAAKSAHLREIGLENLRESLFYRLLRNAEMKGWSDCHAMLSHHHRMHEELAAFVNQHFYERKLEIASETQKRPNLISPIDENDNFGNKLAISRVVYFPSKLEKGSKVNEDEAQRVVELAYYIRDNYEHWYDEPFDEAVHLGIITPFRAQIGKIRQLLQGDFPNLLIDTVERFQGSERDIILISYAVRSPQQLKNIQALTPDRKVDRKLNVALSRAKNHVIITGCKEVLLNGLFFRELLEYCHEKG